MTVSKSSLSILLDRIATLRIEFARMKSANQLNEKASTIGVLDKVFGDEDLIGFAHQCARAYERKVSIIASVHPFASRYQDVINQIDLAFSQKGLNSQINGFLGEHLSDAKLARFEDLDELIQDKQAPFQQLLSIEKLRDAAEALREGLTELEVDEATRAFIDFEINAVIDIADYAENDGVMDGWERVHVASKQLERATHDQTIRVELVNRWSFASLAVLALCWTINSGSETITEWIDLYDRLSPAESETLKKITGVEPTKLLTGPHTPEGKE